MATGTEKKHQEKLYIPKLKVNQIKLELFYEAGHGQVVFDNLSLREAGDKPSDDIKIASHHLEEQIVHSVTKNLADLTKDQKSTYLWSDLADLHQSSHMTATCRRLEEMAKQVSSLASRYYQDKELIRLIKDKLAWLTLNHYHPQKDIEGKANWWDFEIGTPRAIVNTLAFIYPYVTQEEIKRYTKGISHFVPNPRQFRSTLVNPFKAIGGNLVDMGRVKIIEALLKHDKKALQDSIAALDTLFAFQPKGSRGEGFYEDGSYIDHTNVAYTGAYGNVLIDGLSQMVPLLQLLATSLDQQKLEVMTHWIEQAFLPLMVHGELMDMSRGRSISRENASSRQAALEALRGMLRLAEALPEQAKIRIKGKIKAVLAFHNQETILESLSSYYDMKLFKELLEDTTIQASPVKSYLSLFNQMDKLAYYNAEKDFAFALSMHSNKTLNFEAMNDENTRGWYTGDGMFYLYNSDLGHYSDHFWPTVNPLKMAGTTEAEVRREDVTVAYLKKLTNDYKEKAKEKAGMSTLPSSFVGAIKVGDKTALAVMDFQNWDRTVSAKKSWTILDDQIVFLGTAITSQTHQAVTTTIDQRKENPDNSYTLFINGQETALTEEVLYRDDVTSLLLLSKDGQANIGYLFAKPTALALSRKVQSGRWSEINTNSKNEDLISQSFITISQAHSQASDSYAYTLLPNISKADFDKVCSEARIEVLRNDSKLQLIHDKKQDLLAVVKYNQAKEVINGQLSLEKSGLYLYQKVGNDFKQLSFKALS
ncbi:polysaccharide lyase 8 family protein [Streptococcus equi subsp. zooepidemicus]|nr:polysaccharide lyase 8 family protein [Streptococcus equi]MCD3375017.1 polysaccharide lyase 8 family protein [Streptococcus equi subsp. zooepidemicus]